MERYETSTHGLVQAVHDGTSELIWPMFLAVVVLSCIATRLITGLQSSQHEQDPTEPRTARLAPYWFPWMGHGVSFLWNHVNLFTRLRDSMNEPVFGVYLRGIKHDTVVSPSMIESILSSQDSSSAPALDQALQNVFGDRTLVRNLNMDHNREISDDVPSILNRGPFVSEASAAFVRLAQQNTPNLVSFCRSPVDQAPWERSGLVKLPETGDQSICEVNLLALVRGFVGHITTTFLMGEAFVEAFPGALENLWTLDNNFVTLFVGTPRWVPLPGASAGYAARDRLLHIMAVFYRAFTAWDDGIDPGIELRDLDDVSELVKQRMRTFRKLELSPAGSAAGHVSLYWDLMEHTTKITFWMIIHIFADPALLKDIRREIAPYVKSSRPSRQETGFPFEEPPKLALDLEKVLTLCPLFKACYYEAMRLHSAGISFRKMETDVTLSESTDEAAYNLTEPRTYRIRKGEKAILFHGVHHHDFRYFSNPDQYDPLRFIVTDSASGAKRADARTLTPFADGLYSSKSNSFTERATLAFTAGIVSMWEIKSTSGKSLAVPGHKTTWGAFRPAKDVRVKMKLAV
ncbi:hypothetical protein NUU61_002529 [Penicillium alfredii]|uniref:Cytochrome P450 n=1 Tax=Penicillium alfredii TaxID=1506179 RepID=A0A9W9KHC9_9EURO|nr:uncharacterized protein NUU61_002529 [Penicillium alfredii]KAJ5105182.1 hypothetical protein NUU61_002529 [Penicillium alfredii]